MLPARRPARLAHELAELLARQISSGLFPPHSKLPSETQLQASHQLSRAVIREALSQLQARNLVETKHGIGTFVSPNNPPTTAPQSSQYDLASLIETRLLLESEAASLAALRRTPEQLIRLTALHQKMTTFPAPTGGTVPPAPLAPTEASAATGTASVPPAHTAALAPQTPKTPIPLPAEVSVPLTPPAQPPEKPGSVPAHPATASSHLDQQFHLLIAEATANPYLSQILSSLSDQLIPRIHLQTQLNRSGLSHTFLQHRNAEHAQILQAITRQDSLGASAAMRIHLSNSRDRLLQILG
jgi:DNA-binding FadR family transcriptional regulator